MPVSLLRLRSSTALLAVLALAASTAVPVLAATPPVATAGMATPGTAAPPAAPVTHAGPESFADLAARLLPAVVNVSSSSHVEARAGGGPGGCGP
jgi:serine protease Do